MAREFPEWIRRRWGSGESFAQTKAQLHDLGLHTVCQSARCPNQGECWARGTATFLILGSVCSRNCHFCSVATGKPGSVDADEPARVAEAVNRLGLRHAVVTSVTRDDLADGGAAHFAAVVNAIRAKNPGTTVEVLTPDFQGDAAAIGAVIDAGVDVFAHNIETVKRLYPEVRSPEANYERSLGVLKTAADYGGCVVKSGLMVGLGETPDEVRAALSDLLGAGCTAVSIGQYLRPGKAQREVAEFVTPEQFAAYEKLAYDLGFEYAVAGPFVRSSYHAEEALNAETRRAHGS